LPKDIKSANFKPIEKRLKILAIETSCDETAAAVIEKKDNSLFITKSIVSSQIDLHAKTGGVVPEVASRAHMEAIVPIVSEALSLKTTSQINYRESIKALREEITHIAVTAGPGLIGSLLVGFNAAKTISYALDLPIVPINHIEGHIYSAFIKEDKDSSGFKVDEESIKFPLLALIVSGGHTSLILMTDHNQYKQLGSTIDDAVGEAYDKVAKLLGLDYPGGPIISRLATEFRQQNEKEIMELPRPLINDGTFNFSLSGLKTAVLYATRKIVAEKGLDSARDLDENTKRGIAAAFEEAVKDVLVFKTKKAIFKYKPKTVVFGGGVAANQYLGSSLKEMIDKEDRSIKFYKPLLKMTGDNAAMIALAAYYHIKRRAVKDWDEIKVDSNWDLAD